MRNTLYNIFDVMLVLSFTLLVPTNILWYFGFGSRKETPDIGLSGIYTYSILGIRDGDDTKLIGVDISNALIASYILLGFIVIILIYTIGKRKTKDVFRYK
ncbi:MAG: hypothetical protein KatS3mg084_0043 [Candidatus Dojkabacteria bacterium]|jgi:hypothetical protein|nr:MAG: hypothetical protein KatS3mg084_0043 [Candidatus Dojkabacteria bacterium]